MFKANNFLKDFTIYYSNNLIKNPTVSVILPTYCRGDNGLLERAISSVLAQTFTNFELIIVDDGSIDNTKNVIMSFLKKDTRIVYIRNEINSSLPALRVNQGISHSRGKYIAYEFDDDQWLPNFLQDLYGEITKHPEECLVYGRAKLFNTLHGITGEFNNPPNKELLKSRNLIANASVLHHKSLCEKYGMYDMHLFMRPGCDWDLWQRWIEHVNFYLVDKVVALIESHHESSIGITVPYNQFVFNLVCKKPRNHLLTLNNFKDYTLDDIDFITDPILKDVLYQHFILPWNVQKYKHFNMAVEYSLQSDPDIKNIQSIYKKISNIKKSISSSQFIAYVIHSGYIGGAENHLLRHAILSKKFGLNVIVCIPTLFKKISCEIPNICKKHGINLYYLDFDIYLSPNDINEDLAVVKGQKIANFFKTNKVSLIHSCTLIPALKVAGNALGIPYVASLYATSSNAKLFSKTTRKNFFPDIVHSDSILYANIWSNDIKTYSKCIRTYLSDNFFFNKNGTKLNKSLLNVLISGTLQERKQQLNLIEAIGILKKQGIIMNLKVLGYDTFAAPYKKLCMDAINKYGIEKQVTFRGFCEDIQSEMKGIDLLVCASTHESFPQVILEAMAQKILVASTPVGGVPELICNDYSGYISKDFSTSSLVNLLKTIHTDYSSNKTKISKLIDNAYKLAYKECNEYYVANELFMLYEKALTLNTQEAYGYIMDNIHTNFMLVPKENKKYVPQDLGLAASPKIFTKKQYVVNSPVDKLNKLSVYFGTHFKILSGIMIVRIKNLSSTVLVEHRYGMQNIEDNKEFNLIFDSPILVGKSFIIEFEFNFTNISQGISIYEKNGIYIEFN